MSTAEFIFSFPIFKPHRLQNQKLRKKMQKAINNNGLQNSIEELNQFFIGHVRFQYEEGRTEELVQDLENQLQELHENHLKNTYKRLHKLMKDDPELEASLEVFVDIDKRSQVDLSELNTKIKALPQTVIEQISKLFSQGTSFIWDLPGNNLDRIVLGGQDQRSIQLDSKTAEIVDVIADELALTSFGMQHVPVLNRQIEHLRNTLLTFFDNLDGYLVKILEVSDLKEQMRFVDVASVVLGKVLGIREPLSLAIKQVNRYLELKEELVLEETVTNSDFLQKLYEDMINADQLNRNLSKLEEIGNLISEKANHIRDLLKLAENVKISGENSAELNEFYQFAATLYHTFEDFRFTTELFMDIPSFTAISGNVAIETGNLGLEVGQDQVGEKVIYARDLFKTFSLINNTVYALRGIDLDIQQGEYVAIMGPSGSGKTTLLNVLSGLDKADRGILYVNGVNFALASDYELIEFRRQVFSFVYQTYNLLPVLKNLENVSLPADLAGDTKNSERKRRAKKLLERVGLGNFLKGRPLLLSGGQQQRVTIARALMNDPKIIFADEPTGDLDRTTGNEIMDLFEEFNQEGVTIVIVTHDRLIAERADRIIHMLDGKIQKVEVLKKE